MNLRDGTGSNLEGWILGVLGAAWQSFETTRNLVSANKINNAKELEMKLELEAARAAVDAVDLIFDRSSNVACVSQALGDSELAAIRESRCSRTAYFDIAHSAGVLKGIALALDMNVKEFIELIEEPEKVERYSALSACLARAVAARAV